MKTQADKFERYHRQMLLPGIGKGGQMRLMQAHALIVGCGALGTVIAETLARAGIGAITIVDRDVIEITNLQLQVLYDEEDVRLGMPKAEAAKKKIGRLNSNVRVEAHVDDFNADNAERYARHAHIIMDGLDNFETRYLLNDLAVRKGLPYVYGGAVGTTGMAITILPHPRKRDADARPSITWEEGQATPCLRCVFPEAPPPGSSPTCDTAGVLSPVVNIIASIQCAQAIKLITGNIDTLDRRMLNLDLWSNEIRQFDVSGAGDGADCPCCGRGEFTHLEGATGGSTTSLCGRNAVQIVPPSSGEEPTEIDLAPIATRLMTHGELMANRYLIRCTMHKEKGRDETPIELTLFPTGRAIIKGTDEPETARSIYAKYVGS